MIWTWDSCVPGRSAAGVCHDEGRALRVVEAWMREFRASAARVAPVRLDAMGEAYVPAGRPIEAAMDGEDRITWRPAPP